MALDRMAKLLDLEAIAWSSVVETDPARRAPLIAQHRAILAEIAELSKDLTGTGDPVDEIAKRRAARGAGPAKGAGRSGAGAR